MWPLNSIQFEFNLFSCCLGIVMGEIFLFPFLVPWWLVCYSSRIVLFDVVLWTFFHCEKPKWIAKVKLMHEGVIAISMCNIYLLCNYKINKKRYIAGLTCKLSSCIFHYFCQVIDHSIHHITSNLINLHFHLDFHFQNLITGVAVQQGTLDLPFPDHISQLWLVGSRGILKPVQRYSVST